LPWELLCADDLVVIVDSEEDVIEKCLEGQCGSERNYGEVV